MKAGWLTPATTSRRTRKSLQHSHNSRALRRTLTRTKLATARMSAGDTASSGKGTPPASWSCGPARLAGRTPRSVVGLQHGEEGLLGDLHLADHLHPLLARRLLGPQLPLPRDV